MSNHFTGLSLGPPLGDQRLDLCDLYAFQSPADPARTVLILNANPNADALHPEAIYRLAIDNDGDLRNDIAFSYVFSEPDSGQQTVDVYLATGEAAESPEAVGDKIFEGVEVSFGQWQKLALARGFMRDEPLLLILDEPTAALDAETEHALFERYAAAARDRQASGRITLLVSHRFSTVRMADLILVLDGSHLIESGTHDELMAKGGHYADLYTIQATAYR